MTLHVPCVTLDSRSLINASQASISYSMAFYPGAAIVPLAFTSQFISKEAIVQKINTTKEPHVVGTRRKIIATSIGILTASVLAACGTSSSANPEVSQDPDVSIENPLETITIGAPPIAASVAIQYGIDEGIFEKHGFQVEISTANSGAALLPAVHSEQIDFGVGNPLSVFIASDQGLDMRIVSGYSHSADSGEDTAGVVTRKDSGIDSFGDLSDKATAVNALRTLGDLTLMDLAEQDGTNPEALNFAEMPFPDMLAQLEQGNTDAIWIPEPFLTTALEDPENKLLGYSFRESVEGMHTMVTFTSGAYAEENPESTKRFHGAMVEVLAAADENPEKSKELLPNFIDLPVEIAEKLKLDALDGEVRMDQLDQVGELASKYGFVESAPDVSELVVNG